MNHDGRHRPTTTMVPHLRRRKQSFNLLHNSSTLLKLESLISINFVEQHSNSAFVKSHNMRCVLGRKDTKDGPLCVITPEESGWYHAYVNNFLLDKADLFAQITFLLTLP